MRTGVRRQILEERHLQHFGEAAAPVELDTAHEGIVPGKVGEDPRCHYAAWGRSLRPSAFITPRNVESRGSPWVESAL
jgi:hypothetical protein